MKKLLTLIMVLCLVIGGASCKDKGKTSGGASTWEEAKQNATRLTIYMDESNVYGPYVNGGDEAYVKDAIEKKFWEDTGNAIDLNITVYPHDNFFSSFSGVMTTSRWDAVVSYLGQAGLEETVLNQDVALDIADYLADAPNLTKAVDRNAFYATTTFEGNVIGIPSVNNTRSRGILIRKDYMHAVGYTDDESESGYKVVKSIKDFDDMIRAMKEHYSSIENFTPIVGNSYDMEFTLLAGACGTAGYQYRAVVKNADGSVKEVVPGWLSEGYGEMLEYMYKWQRDGLWESDHLTISDETRINKLAGGKAAVYCVDPTITNLISVARRVKNVKGNENVEFTVMGPLDAVDENGNDKPNTGKFVENSRTTDCLVINSLTSRAKAQLVIKYLDWMYSSVDNYELCAHGIKGEHWIDAGAGYYSYPEEVKDVFFLRAPYSGKFMLLHNDEFSYRLYNDYTEEEIKWINFVKNAPSMKSETDGMLFYNLPASVNANFTTAEADMYEDCVVRAWNGLSDPKDIYGGAVEKYRNQAGDYIEWLTNQYKLYLSVRG